MTEIDKTSLSEKGKGTSIAEAEADVLNLSRSVNSSCSEEHQNPDDLHVSNNRMTPKKCGKQYIPHGHGQERVYKPHIFNRERHYTECGLDWKSRLRWLPAPTYSSAPFPQIKACKFPEEIRLCRSFPQANRKSDSEWTFYPDFGLPFTYHVGKKCIFEESYLANRESVSEMTLPMLLGRKRYVHAPRNDLPVRSAGDKPYHTPEYSSSFHKMGSTRPVINFGGPRKVKIDTFIPLQQLPQVPRLPYREKERMQQQEQDKKEVKLLEEWRAATPVILSVISH